MMHDVESMTSDTPLVSDSGSSLPPFSILEADPDGRFSGNPVVDASMNRWGRQTSDGSSMECQVSVSGFPGHIVHVA